MSATALSTALHRRSHGAVADIAASTSLLDRYLAVRAQTEALTAPLGAEDMALQSMDDASPTKWHLGHTTWFFETFVLARARPVYRAYEPGFGYLFNSYYQAAGPRHPRPRRGLISRPTTDEVMAYRQHVDDHMLGLLQAGVDGQLAAIIELGIAHEQQHQELLQMDILHLFAQSPLRPAYHRTLPLKRFPLRPSRFQSIDGGLVSIGAEGDGFAYDNEGPAHRVWLEPYEIGKRLVTNAEWMAFMADGGYRSAQWWLSDGWDAVNTHHWQAPLYWEHDGADWRHMTLHGMQPIDPQAPVTHVSYYEAAAFARWRGARLPTEAEWEHAASSGRLEQLYDAAWQWTRSAYEAYPGYNASADALGEYNGKFMSGQMVLRGAADVTPADHVRPSYRNFYRPEQRWMFSGVRLARDLPAQRKAIMIDSEFARDVVAGLGAAHKTLSPKYFYDAAGSALFEQICLTPEYYPTRTELALLAEVAPALVANVAAHAVLVEPGSGASEKTRLLLDAAPHIGTYVPIDISADALDQAAERLKASYPRLHVLPVAGDFTKDLRLPEAAADRPIVGFFPGSTIGNFEPAQASALLRLLRDRLGTNSQLIVGVDLVKDRQTLLAAYDDAQGVTARFNKNLLVRINRELGGNFDLDAFDHQAIWNEDKQRIEMHLVSRKDQRVSVAGKTFAFRTGESIHTENSHKFTRASFEHLLLATGWSIAQAWTSEQPPFAIFKLRADE